VDKLLQRTDVFICAVLVCSAHYRFLAVRIYGRAIGTVLRLSSVVCNVKYCG